MTVQVVYNNENTSENVIHNKNSLKNPTKIKQGGSSSRPPLSSIDSNSSSANNSTNSTAMKKFSFSSKEVRKGTKKSLMKLKIHGDGGGGGGRGGGGSKDTVTKLNSTRSTNSNVKPFRDSRNDEEEFWTDEMDDLLTLRLATPIHDAGEYENEASSVSDRSSSDATTPLHCDDRLESSLAQMAL